MDENLLSGGVVRYYQAISGLLDKYLFCFIFSGIYLVKFSFMGKSIGNYSQQIW
jgi:hypothetical protein